MVKLNANFYFSDTFRQQFVTAVTVSCGCTMAGDLKKQKQSGKLTSSQINARSSQVLPGHVLVNEKFQGSLLAKTLRGTT